MREHVARLSRATLIYGAGSVLARTVNLLLLPVLTSYLTPSDFGVTAILGVINLVLTPIFSLGLGAGIGALYFQPGQERLKEKTIWTAVVLVAISSTLLLVIALTASGQVSQLAFGTAQFAPLVRLTMISMCFTILATPFLLCLQFEERARTFVVVSTMSTLTSIGLSVFLVVARHAGVAGMVYGQLVGQLVSVILATALVAPGMAFRIERSVARALLRLGLPLIPAFFFLFVLQNGNKYLVQRLSGLGAAGIYNVGANFGLMLSLLVSAFSSSWLPFALSFSDRRSDASRVFGRVMTYYVLGCGSLSLMFFIAARPVVLLATAAPFHDAYQIVGLSATGQLLSGVLMILLPAVYMAEELHVVTLVQGISAVFSVVVTVVLIRAFGNLGAALGMALGLFMMDVVQYLWNRLRGDRYLKVQYEWPRLAGFALLYVLVGSAYLVPRDLSLAGELVLTAIGTALLPMMIYAFLNENERRALWRIAGTRLPGRARWQSNEA